MSKLSKRIIGHLTADGSELADYVRTSGAPSAELVTELHDLRDRVEGLSRLIEFLANGIEYEVWKEEAEILLEKTS